MQGNVLMCVDELRLWYLMDMQTKDKLENLDEKLELMEIRNEQRHMEILIVLESLKANASVASSSPQVQWKVANCLLNVWRHVYQYLQSSHQHKVLRVLSTPLHGLESAESSSSS